MNTLYKNKGETSDKMQILGVGALFLFALFVLLLYPDHSAQQHANQADNLCQQLSMMRAAEMSAQQKRQAQECDSHDAEQAWENQYGTMSEQDKTEAVVYE